jgi:hypothetical protein
MSSGAAIDAQIMQATGDLHNGIGQALGGVAELVFSDATDFHSSHRMLDAHARPRQMAIVPFLGRCQRMLLGLFFGCRCVRTLGA